MRRPWRRNSGRRMHIPSNFAHPLSIATPIALIALSTHSCSPQRLLPAPLSPQTHTHHQLSDQKMVFSSVLLLHNTESTLLPSAMLSAGYYDSYYYYYQPYYYYYQR